MSRLSIALALPLLAAACSPYAYQANCLNEHVSPEYGQVREIPGGFEISGSGVAYTTIEVSQTTAPRGDADPIESSYGSGRSTMRTFSCRPVEDR